MLPFFRRIRRQLAEDNKTLKYLKYAIGEIVLVVIGILIALQINNWNEDRQVRKAEVKILQELYTTLIGDLEHQNDEIHVNKASREAAQYLLRYFEGNQLYRDTLAICFSTAHSRGHGLARTHAYQNAKAHGLDFLVTDSLKELLTWTYEVNTSWLDELNTRNNLFENETVIPLLSNLFEAVYFSDILDKLGKFMVPLDYNSIRYNAEYLGILRTTIYKRDEFLWFQERRYRRMNRLKEMLEQELRSKPSG